MTRILHTVRINDVQLFSAEIKEKINKFNVDNFQD